MANFDELVSALHRNWASTTTAQPRIVEIGLSHAARFGLGLRSCIRVSGTHGTSAL